jgi:hypothetical protein
MRSAGHSHAALLLIGAALLAVLAVVALNTLSQPSLPPAVNAIEIGEPREEMSSRTKANPARDTDPEPRVDRDRDAETGTATEPEPAGEASGERSIPPIEAGDTSPRPSDPSGSEPAPAPAPPAEPENGDDAGED